jgi:hypothetical protein
MANSRNAEIEIIEDLIDYIVERKKQKKYTGSFFGYSKQAKISAAKNLIESINTKTSNAAYMVSFDDLDALRQGNLSKIWEKFKSLLPIKYLAIVKHESEVKSYNSRVQASMDTWDYHYRRSSPNPYG